MEFIREKIKEKPISKKRIAMRVGMAALCGLVFAIVVCVVLVIAVPYIIPKQEENESVSSQEESQQEEVTQYTEDRNEGLVFPPDFNLTISDYETLQSELYKIGNQTNKSMVTVMKMENPNDWTVNDYETEGKGSGVIISEDSNYL